MEIAITRESLHSSMIGVDSRNIEAGTSSCYDVAASSAALMVSTVADYFGSNYFLFVSTDVLIEAALSPIDWESFRNEDYNDVAIRLDAMFMEYLNLSLGTFSSEGSSSSPR